MINFCNVDLAEIICNKPSCDGYPVTNLIATDSNRKQGFLADYFVKYNVEILLRFCCSIDLKKIKLNCAVGSQKSKLIEIVTETSNNLKLTVGKGSLDKNEKYLVFYFQGTQKDEQGKHELFYHGRNLFNVKHVTIKILQTEGSTVPALGGLEVWGYIALDVPKPIRNFVWSLWKKIQSPLTIESEAIAEPEKSLIKERPNLPNNFTIPEELLDPITCDIFTIPMMLPSGKIVDITTLEKFYIAEEKWGRGRSDPYTGVLFTDNNKPVVATALKERLDKFIMENCNQTVLKNIPRTVGKSLKHCPLLPASECYSRSRSVSDGVARLRKDRPKDVDSLLEQTLCGLPTFLEKPTKKQKVQCMKCNKAELLFKLLCEHFICRHCLVIMDKSTDNKCICNKTISFNDIIRYHISL